MTTCQLIKKLKLITNYKHTPRGYSKSLIKDLHNKNNIKKKNTYKL